MVRIPAGPRLILQGLLRARTVLSAAAAGATARSAVALPTASGATPTFASSTSASAWFSSRSQLADHSGFTYELERVAEKMQGRRGMGRSPYF
jgi:hypothetical protein